MGRLKWKTSERVEVSIDIFQSNDDPNILMLHSLQVYAIDQASRGTRDRNANAFCKRRCGAFSNRRIDTTALEKQLEFIVFNELGSIDIALLEPHSAIALRVAFFLVKRDTGGRFFQNGDIRFMHYVKHKLSGAYVQ